MVAVAGAVVGTGVAARCRGGAALPPPLPRPLRRPDLLVPDDVVHAEGGGVLLYPVADLHPQRLPGRRGVAGDHDVDGAGEVGVVAGVGADRGDLRKLLRDAAGDGQRVGGELVLLGRHRGGRTVQARSPTAGLLAVLAAGAGQRLVDVAGRGGEPGLVEGLQQGAGDLLELGRHLRVGGSLDAVGGLADRQPRPTVDLLQPGDGVAGRAGGLAASSSGGGHVGGGDLLAEQEDAGAVGGVVDLVDGAVPARLGPLGEDAAVAVAVRSPRAGIRAERGLLLRGGDGDLEREVGVGGRPAFLLPDLQGGGVDALRDPHLVLGQVPDLADVSPGAVRRWSGSGPSW